MTVGLLKLWELKSLFRRHRAPYDNFFAIPVYFYGLTRVFCAPDPYIVLVDFYAHVEGTVIGKNNLTRKRRVLLCILQAPLSKLIMRCMITVLKVQFDWKFARKHVRSVSQYNMNSAPCNSKFLHCSSQKPALISHKVIRLFFLAWTTLQVSQMRLHFLPLHGSSTFELIVNYSLDNKDILHT